LLLLHALLHTKKCVYGKGHLLTCGPIGSIAQRPTKDGELRR